MEKWKEIKGYEGYYEVSNDGNVKSLKRVLTIPNSYSKSATPRTVVRQGRVLSQKVSQGGYNKVSLSFNRETVLYHVHVLVARAFVSNPDNLEFVAHIDGNTKNNRASNLKWVATSEDIKLKIPPPLKKPYSIYQECPLCRRLPERIGSKIGCTHCNLFTTGKWNNLVERTNKFLNKT